MLMNRRDALRTGATLFGVPWQKVVGATPAPLPDDALFTRDPETYWKRMREEQFFLPEWRSFLNNGSLGVLPRPVVRTMAKYLEDAAALETPYPYPRWGYETLDEEREELSKYLGCAKDELAIMHNATEAITTEASGLDLKAGDEVLMTSLEHTSGKAGWEQKRARYRSDDFGHRPEDAHRELQRNYQSDRLDHADPRNLRRGARQRRADAGRRGAYARADGSEALRSALRFLCRESS
jgi:hypothetical protein